MTRIISAFLISVFFISSLLSQNDELILAKIGNKNITKNEFVKRFEMTPHMNLAAGSSMELFKKQFLSTLIAEKLLAAEAENISLDTAEVVRYSLNMFEKMFARDELYRLEIIKKSKSMADSLLADYLGKASGIKVDYIAVSTEDSINSVFKKIKDGLTFNEIISTQKGIRSDTLTLSRGDIEEDIEELLFNLSKDDYTEPVYGAGEYFIFRLIEKKFPVLIKSPGWEEEYKKIEKAAVERAEQKYYQEYMRKIFGSRKVDADARLLRKLTEIIYSILGEKEKINDKVYLSINDLIVIEDQLSENRNENIIILDNHAVSLIDFIRYFRFEEFALTEVTKEKVASLLNFKTKKFIEHEILAQIAFERGLQNTDEVREQYEMWKDNYLYNLMQSSMADSIIVSDEEVLEYYNAVNKRSDVPQQVNIAEILTDNLETVEVIFNELSKGADFKELAGQYSLNWNSENPGGESGFFPVTKNEVGRIAAGFEIGEVYGPLKTEEGFIIFKVIDKKDKTFNYPLSFTENKEEIKKELAYKMMREYKIKYTAMLAGKYQVKIFYENLNDVPVTSHNALTYKLLGFGGKITAVPVIAPFNEWVKEWKENESLNP